ncbi:hypothetical protein TSMEX_000109 [Taenia solium]|eukprot:TsM_000889100 transcript=TsM_000889100 gene=TsM_000889100
MQPPPEGGRRQTDVPGAQFKYWIFEDNSTRSWERSFLCIQFEGMARQSILGAMLARMSFDPLYEVPFGRVQVERCLGRDAFGHVFHGLGDLSPASPGISLYIKSKYADEKRLIGKRLTE